MPAISAWRLSIDGRAAAPSQWNQVAAGVHEVELEVTAVAARGVAHGRCRSTVATPDDAAVDVSFPELFGVPATTT